jgi:hypothetical protein
MSALSEITHEQIQMLSRCNKTRRVERMKKKTQRKAVVSYTFYQATVHLQDKVLALTSNLTMLYQ